MHKESFDDWQSMYRDEEDNLYQIWTSEKPELRRITMLNHVLRKELDKLKSNLTDEIGEVKSMVKQRNQVKTSNGLADCESFNGFLGQLLNSNKENLPAKQLPTIQLDDDETTTDISRPNTPEPVQSIRPQSPVDKSPILGMRNQLLRNIKKPKTPQLNDTDILESSIIDKTPEVLVKRQRTGRSIAERCRKKLTKKKFEQNNTLTQMFDTSKSTKGTSNESDNIQASMNIEQMMDLINKDASDESQVSINFMSALRRNPRKRVQDKSIQFNDKTKPQEKTVTDESMDFIQNYDRIPEKKVEQPAFAYVEVVRGKEARKKLKGWSCKECENYYKFLRLPPEELEKKMDECSKHRSKFKRQDTFDGFWDLSFGPTPETP